MRKKRRRCWSGFGWVLLLVVILLACVLGNMIHLRWQKGTWFGELSSIFDCRDSWTASEDYPDSLIQLARDNPETEQFVKDYPENKDNKKSSLSPKDLSGNRDTQIPLFLQWDERWGYRQYGGDFLALTGCGPTCLSMVYCGLYQDTKWNPYRVAKMAERKGFYVEDQGTSWELMWEGAAALDLEGSELSLDKKSIQETLQVGKPIICAVREGDFTKSGHFIVLAGLDSQGRVIVNDPNSRERSSQSWDMERLMQQIKNLWAYQINPS